MARRRRGRSNYSQVKTGTVDLGNAGAQIHIASVRMLDDAIKGAYLNNIQYSVMDQGGRSATTTATTAPAFTVYLSTEDSAAGWSDDQVIAVSSTAAGGGNGSLSCKRSIQTDAMSVQSARDIGPVHIWLEGTDIPATSGNLEARITLTAWGRMILLVEDF